MKPVRTPFPTTCYSDPGREGLPATVLRSLKSLQKMELVHRETDGEGNSYYGIYDILFRRWIDKKTL